MKKRVLPLFLALALCVGLCVVPAGAAGAFITEVVPCKYHYIWSWSFGYPDNFAVVELGRKYGCIDASGKEVVPCQYDYIEKFSNGFAQVKLNGKRGFIDATGKEVVPCKYDDVEDFSEGLAAVKLNNKWGYIDTTGKEVIPCQYFRAFDFHEGLACVELESQERRYIDAAGREVFSGTYDSYGGQFFNGAVKVYLNGKCGIMDKTGQELVPCKYDSVYNNVNTFAGDLAKVELDGKYGVIDRTGREIVPCKYDSVNTFARDLAYVELDDKYGVIDRTGREIVPCQYDNMWPIQNGLSRVEKGDKYGYIDTTGREVVPCKYDEASEFSDGLAMVGMATGETTKSGQNIYVRGFIDATGREVIPCIYDGAWSFSEGLAAVGKATGERNQIGGKICKWGYIDTTGREVIPFRYDDLRPFSEGLALVTCIWGRGTENEVTKYGYVDKSGQEIVPCTYDDADPFRNGYAQVKKNGMSGLLHADLNRIAYPSTQTIHVDDEPVEVQFYALKDEAGNDTNYIKLRDLAYILNGTKSQFQVEWDGEVKIEADTPYTPNGSEMKTPFSGERVCETPMGKSVSNGKLFYQTNGSDTPDAIVLKDDQGGAYTYYKLRALQGSLHFEVKWDEEEGIMIHPVPRWGIEFMD